MLKIFNFYQYKDLYNLMKIKYLNMYIEII